MTIVKPKTKEQLIYFLISNLSLGTYDRRFLQNIQDTYIVPKKPLTSNQTQLLDKVVARYHRQLAKLETDSKELLNLPWTLTPVDSLPQYTEVFLDLIDDTLVLRSPYKKEFVTEFKKVTLNARWDIESRFWYIPASTHSLRIVNEHITKHYSKINYCDTLQCFFSEIEQYRDATYWDPTYKYVNGNFMIAASNKWLDDALKDLVFDDNLSTISQLVWYGIEIDDSVITECLKKYDPMYVEFAVNMRPTTEYKDDSIIDKMIQSGVDFVLLNNRLYKDRDYIQQLTESFTKNNIEYHLYDENEILELNLSSRRNPIMLCDRNTHTDSSRIFSKMIRIVNSKPITIK